MSRIYEGCGTRNWCLHAAEGWFFIKEYPGQINVDEERQALDLARYARDCGIPTPRVIATRSEDLICRNDDATFVLFEWADGCTAKRSLSLEQMAQAGRVLGDMHRHFSTLDSRLPSDTSRWLRFDAADKLSEIDHYIHHPTKTRAGQLRQRDTSLADRTQTARSGSSQDASPPHPHNSGDTQRLWPPERDVQRHRVSAVVDFQPPRPFLIAYEVGRIAFGPENFTSSGWMEKASVLIRAYCRAHRVAIHDICFAPHIWLVQLIRSMYGVKQHYTRPVELQDALDRFWFQRAHAAQTLFAKLGTAQAILRSVWETSAGDGRPR